MHSKTDKKRNVAVSALNRSSFHRFGFEPARVTCETSQVLLVGDQVVFLDRPPFPPPTSRLTRLKMSVIILTGRRAPPPPPQNKTKKKKQKKKQTLNRSGSHHCWIEHRLCRM